MINVFLTQACRLRALRPGIYNAQTGIRKERQKQKNKLN